MQKRDNMRNIIVVSDTHCGCQFGLCPDKIQIDAGGTYESSDPQKEVYKKWLEFWNEWVPHITKNEPYIVVHNGDIVDGSHHNSVTQITHNLADQANIATLCMDPVLSAKKCKDYYHIRGTEVHVGQSGQDEERIAKRLGAIPNEAGNYSRHDLWLELGGKLIHFSHHIGTSSSSSYESTAVFKELVEAYNEAGRWHERPPDLLVRSHRHRAFKIEIPAEGGFAMSLVTPGWQLITPFVWRLASGRASTPQIGGYLIRSGDEDGLYTRGKIWKTGRSKTIIL